jgi:hypothetical protein
MTSESAAQIPTVEGDPNRIPERSRLGGPQQAWVRACDLGVGDRVMLSNKFVHTVIESAPEDGNLWKLTIANPEVAPTTERSRREKLGPTFPRERHYVHVRDFPYRKIVS